MKLLALLFLLPAVAYSQTILGCFPQVPRGVILDSFNDELGTWYNYKALRNPFTGTQKNIIAVNRDLGQLRTDPLTRVTHASFWVVQYRQADVTGQPCAYVYLQENTTCNGQKAARIWVQPPSNASNDGTYVIQYIDKDFLMIRFICLTPPDPSGICQLPEMQVLTRKHPNLLTAEEDALLIDIVNETLEPYCLGYADLDTNPWDDTLPVCPWADRPQAFKDLIQTIKTRALADCIQPQRPF